jgi:hypothetical protein
MQLLLPLWEQQVATSLVQLAGQWLRSMPAGSFAPRVTVVFGFRDYTHHQEAATKALPHVFAGAKHFHAKNAEGEFSNK